MTTIDQKKAELRCKIDKIFSKMSSRAWDDIYDCKTANKLSVSDECSYEPVAQDFLDQIEQDGLKDAFESVITLKYNDEDEHLHTDTIRYIDGVILERAVVRNYYVYTTSEVNETLYANCENMLDDSDGIHLILIIDSYYSGYDASYYGTLPQVLENIRCFYDVHPDIYDPIIVCNHWGRSYSCKVEQIVEREGYEK